MGEEWSPKEAGDDVTEHLPMITIGVPTYNRAWCLPIFLNAVEKLDYPKDRIRIVFVDNFSEDETPKMLGQFKKRLGQDYESVVIVSEKSNIPEARNTCVRNLAGEYLLFLDTDVIPPPETVKRMLEVLASNPKAAIVGFPYRCEPPTLAEKMYFSKQPRTPHVVTVIGMGCTIIRRQVLDEIGLFDPKYVADEDADLTVRARKAGYMALLDPTRTPLHLTRERLHGTLNEIAGYFSYSFGPLAKYHFMILQKHKPRWMIRKVILYLLMAASIPLALTGIALRNLLLILPFIACIGFVFAYHFSRASGKWRVVNPVFLPLFGMSFALGILKEYMKARIRDRSTKSGAQYSRKQKVKVLFVYSALPSFVRRDLEILRRNFYVEEVQTVTFLVPRVARDFFLLIRLLKAVSRVDVVYSWFADVHSLYAVLFSFILHKKSFVVVAGYEAACVPEMDYGLMLHERSAWTVKQVLRFASRILAVSQFSRKEVVNYVPPGKVTLLYNGVDCARFAPVGEKHNDLVLMVGPISKDEIIIHGLDTYIKAARILPKIEFLAIGILKEAADHLSKYVPPNVTLVGLVSQNDLIPYYQKAKAYCQLSYRESFGLSLAEAMCCECVPVVTRNGGAVSEVVGNSGFYARFNDAENVAQKIREALRSEKGKKARERILKHFSITRRERELVDLIQKMIAK